ncbi:ankyrin repeat-containing domain protein [Nemania abortiva]|nr:ankyrin repeat-containing domain protein [Nemania abortiva]
MKSRKDASELLHKYPFLSHAVRCWGTYCREFDSRMIDGQQSQEKRLPLTYKGKVLEIHDGEARYYYEVTEPIEEIAQHNTQLNSEEESLGAEGPAEELQKQLQALASLSFKVSTRTSELIEDRAKISMAVLLATYLSPDSSTSHLSWITLSSWVTSMSDLAIASRLGLNREVTQRSLGRDENCLNFQDSRGNTPLHEAVKAGFEDVVRTLLDAGASVSVMNLSSMTPVEYAMDYRRTRIFLIIFEYMYSINAGPRDEDGKLATYYCSCVAGDQIDTGRLLALGLFHAVKIPNSEIVRKLLKTGADPDAFDNENIPVLHHAIRSSAQAENRSGDRRCPAELLYSGADPTIQSRDGKNESALHVAIRYGDLLSAKRLLRYGADPNSTDAKGRPPIFALFDSEAEYSDDGYSEIISELAGWGADLDQPDYKHDRALHLAAQRRLPYVIQLLIWMGADCNQKDEDGMRPLEYAQRMKDEESITILTSFTNGSTRPGKK